MVTEEKMKKKSQTVKNKYFIFNLIILITAAIVTIININSTGSYPWGENTFRYLATNNVSFTFNIFVVINFILGGIGFLLWGYYFGRQKFCLFLAILWFFIPSNLRVLFSDGNLPITIINSIIPYLFLIYYKSINEDNKLNYFILALIAAIMTLLNASVTIMLLSLLYICNLIRVLFKKIEKKEFLILGVLTIAVLSIKTIFVPEMENLLMPKAIEFLVYPFAQSINPFIRFENIQIYYLGISFVITVILGIMFSNNDNKEKSLFWIALVMFIGTSSSLLVFLEKVTFSEFITVSRIASIAIAFILFGLVRWKNLNKLVLIMICFFISFDSMMSFEILGFNKGLPEKLIEALDIASEIATQKIGVLDISSYGSFPSSYLSSEKNFTEEKQMIGFNWMKSENKSDVIAINTALENNYFSIMFDRSLQLGADTLLVKKSYIKDFEELEYWANNTGYEKRYEDDGVIIYKYPVDYKFKTKVKYSGIAIGKYSSNIIYNFPSFNVGKSTYIDDFDIDDLKKYKSIFLSGFEYNDKNKAESMIKELSDYGIKVVIDMTGIDKDGVLGVIPQEISLIENYGQVYYQGNQVSFNDFPSDLYYFKCNYIGNKNSDNDNYAVAGTLLLNYLYSANENLHFVGMNLPYYALKTKDEEAIKILEDIFKIKANELPERTIQEGGQV
ncbi:MAG: 6-pyruvoyl-tetrahydropterin synthase-related protein [Clostridium sp.]